MFHSCSQMVVLSVSLEYQLVLFCAFASFFFLLSSFLFSSFALDTSLPE